MINKKKPLILVTNDDGISAGGIRFLINIARKYGRVLVVAPDSVQSAKSHSITQATPLILNKIDEEKDYVEYSCSGTPVDCVKLANHKISLERPDLVLSGINHGTNTAISVIYSGTMAAAIEASLNNIPAVGFSVNSYASKIDFSQLTPYIEDILNKVLTKGLPDNVSLNINFPDPSTETIKGMRVCRATKGAWAEDFKDACNPHGKNSMWITGAFNNFEPDAKDTDEYFIKNGYASIVPIKPRFTAHEHIETLKEWNL